ncbi:tRNA N(3)-methylcytidine methyltransferase METTL2A isoform X5 [Mirounga angustirostris]|uniref:tRNA N(3)-methylcytidine methyltransferase METTL2A isoform X5 n=1 Tax=Mirounga angustirostris TaxID=9716 RepID=UPI00313C7FF9
MPGTMWSGRKSRPRQRRGKSGRTVPSGCARRSKLIMKSMPTNTGMSSTKSTKTGFSRIDIGFSLNSQSWHLARTKMTLMIGSQRTRGVKYLKVGCGVGNTVFPILQTNRDPGLFVYCCDFSSTAVELVQTDSAYDPCRCFAFVHDLCDEDTSYPVPGESLDIIILIFVLSAVVPDKMQKAINRLSRLLKPGGMMLLRDYGRYDMAQLRFKKGQCLSENFYVRGDGTRVYFFTQGMKTLIFVYASRPPNTSSDVAPCTLRSKTVGPSHLWGPLPPCAQLPGTRSLFCRQAPLTGAFSPPHGPPAVRSSSQSLCPKQETCPILRTRLVSP